MYIGNTARPSSKFIPVSVWYIVATYISVHESSVDMNGGNYLIHNILKYRV